VSDIPVTSPKKVLVENHKEAATKIRAFTQTPEFHLWMTCALAELALTCPNQDMFVGAERLKDILEQIPEVTKNPVTIKVRSLSHRSPDQR
jgi:hypothetical protein